MAGPDIRVQAREGRRATVMQLRPGLWLLGDLDEAALEELMSEKSDQAEIGVAPLIPLLTPVLIAAATTALNPNAKGPGKDMMNKVGKLFGKGRRRQRRAPEPEAIEAYFEDEDDVELGCAGRRCRCRR